MPRSLVPGAFFVVCQALNSTLQPQTNSLGFRTRALELRDSGLSALQSLLKKEKRSVKWNDQGSFHTL